MTLRDFIRHLKENDCELIPMPEWNRVSTLKIVHKKSGRTAYLNTNIRGEVFDDIIFAVCFRLGIPSPLRG